MAWITPKLDWTANDYINLADWNRIENNIKEVAAYLNSIYYTIPTLTTVTNRTNLYVDGLASINRIEQNLETIRAYFVTPTGYKGAKTWKVRQPFDYNDAIRLEENVKLLMDYGLIAFDSFIYCGVWTTGMERGMI